MFGARDEVTDWQNIIPYGGTERDNVVIIRTHGSLTGKCYHQNGRTQIMSSLLGHMVH